MQNHIGRVVNFFVKELSRKDCLVPCVKQCLDEMYEWMKNWIPILHHGLGRYDNEVMSSTQTGFTEAHAQNLKLDSEFDL